MISSQKAQIHVWLLTYEFDFGFVFPLFNFCIATPVLSIQTTNTPNCEVVQI